MNSLIRSVLGSMMRFLSKCIHVSIIYRIMQSKEKELIPRIIDDYETIVRVLNSFECNHKKKPTYRAFLPRHDRKKEGSTSSIRQLMGDDFCKDKGVEINGGYEAWSNGRRPLFVGFLAILAIDIKRSDCGVEDTRDIFLGHSDITFGLPDPLPQEPLSASETDALLQRCKALLGFAVLRLDPSPSRPGWSAPTLARGQAR